MSDGDGGCEDEAKGWDKDVDPEADDADDIGL
jgi:hypothetical protein